VPTCAAVAVPAVPTAAPTDQLGSILAFEGQRAGLLVGSLDNGTSFFPVGSGPMIVTGSGPLSLGLNDGTVYRDNTGSYTAVIVLFPMLPLPGGAAIGI
jgi:hypothetical protein